jgi:hypothetical protein
MMIRLNNKSLSYMHISGEILKGNEV